MSDLELRTAQRAADGRDLAWRVRSGDLSFERIEWAARLGDERALAVVGKLTKAPTDWDSWWDRRYAIRGVAEAVLGHDYKRVIVAFACDCAEHVLPLFETRYPNDRRPREAIEAARAWVVAAAAGPVSDEVVWMVRAARDAAWQCRYDDAAAAAADDAAAAAAAAAVVAAADARDAVYTQAIEFYGVLIDA